MKEIIYITERLKTAPHGKDVAQKLEEHFNGELKILPHSSKNKWCRDYMPVKNANGDLVQFVYNPSYLNSQSGQGTIPDVQKIHKALNLNPIQSEIILDGGAVELYGKKAIVSDRVFRDNHPGSFSEIDDELKDKLAVENLNIVPQHPYDFTGHVEGMVRFVNEDTVIINDLAKELSDAQLLIEGKLDGQSNPNRGKLIVNWYYSFNSALLNAGLEVRTIPYAVHKAENDTSHREFILIFSISRIDS